ncbi:MAG: hypothetical protein ACRD1R_20240 [Acidobacteriota bacterium]
MKVLSLLAVAVSLLMGAVRAAPAQSNETREIILQGQVLCMDAAGKHHASCPEHPARYGLRTLQGDFYLFKSADTRTVMFTDPRVRRRTLQITAWMDGSRELEIIKIQSVHEDAVFDLYYRCEVCNITTHTPGPCWCCQQEFEFRETPAKQE